MMFFNNSLLLLDKFVCENGEVRCEKWDMSAGIKDVYVEYFKNEIRY